jgi:hypothetical protein
METSGSVLWNETSFASSKKVVKGEDRLLCLPSVVVPSFGGLCMSVFGVFDGHGGKHTAEFLLRDLCRALLEELVREASRARTRISSADSAQLQRAHSHTLSGGACATCTRTCGVARFPCGADRNPQPLVCLGFRRARPLRLLSRRP